MPPLPPDAPGRAVALRPLREDDAATIAGWGADEEFRRHADWAPDVPVAERRAAQERLVAEPPPDLLRLGAELDGDLVGYVDLHGLEADRRELGFVVGERDRWGSGLGLRLAAAGLDHGFGRLGLRRVWAEALEANVRSVRILQRLGMTQTGVGDDGDFLGEPTRCLRFEISAADWTQP